MRQCYTFDNALDQAEEEEESETMLVQRTSQFRTNRAETRSAKRAAFTLLEILVVVAIIVVLAAIAVPITLNVLGEQKKAIAQASMKSNIVAAVKAVK